MSWGQPRPALKKGGTLFVVRYYREGRPTNLYLVDVADTRIPDSARAREEKIDQVLQHRRAPTTWGQKSVAESYARYMNELMDAESGSRTRCKVEALQ